MGDVGACWDNAVVERFFGSLKHDWLFKVAQPTREHMKADVAAYMKYYNLERLHTANENLSPINYENSLKKVSGWSWPVHGDVNGDGLTDVIWAGGIDGKGLRAYAAISNGDGTFGYANWSAPRNSGGFSDYSALTGVVV